jgi:hypothetical protein
VTDCPAKEGVVGTQKVRPAAWQEQVIAKVNYADYERVRLWPPGRKDDDPILAATNQRLEAACRVAGGQRNGEPLQRRLWIVRLANWPTKVWTGAPIKAAFVHPTRPWSGSSTRTPRRTSRRAAQVSWPGCKPVSQGGHVVGMRSMRHPEGAI